MKKKVILSICVICIAIISFVSGYFTGISSCNTKSYKHFKQKSISFFSVKKHLGEKISQEEKHATKIFIATYEECLQEKLDKNEIDVLENIKLEVLNLSKNNEKIKFKLSDLKSYNNNQNSKKIVKQARKCQKTAYKHMTKNDKRLFKKSLSKMPVKDIVSIYYGIK